MRMLTPFPSLELLLLLPLLLLLELSAADWACCAAALSAILTVSLWPLCLSSSYASSTLSRPSSKREWGDKSFMRCAPSSFRAHSSDLQFCLYR